MSRKLLLITLIVSIVSRKCTKVNWSKLKWWKKYIGITRIAHFRIATDLHHSKFKQRITILSLAQQDKTIAMCVNCCHSVVYASALCRFPLRCLRLRFCFRSSSWKLTVRCVLRTASSQSYGKLFTFFLYICFSMSICACGFYCYQSMFCHFFLLFFLLLYSFQLFPFFFVIDFERSADAWDQPIWMKEHLDFSIQMFRAYSVQCLILRLIAKTAGIEFQCHCWHHRVQCSLICYSFVQWFFDQNCVLLLLMMCCLLLQLLMFVIQLLVALTMDVFMKCLWMIASNQRKSIWNS